MKFHDVRIGPGVVRRLLPQRSPFLMVDRIEAYALEPVPALRASRYLTINEPMFEGHYPELPLLPGSMLFEGLAQAASVLIALETAGRAYVERGAGFDALAADLENLDLGLTLDPGYRPDRSEELRRALDQLAGYPVGVAGSAQLKFLRPVFPGSTLVYEVRLTRRLGTQMQFEAEATVEDRPVARGKFAAATVWETPLPRG
jgi:3-hydroxymyristoyl/3-hydroxydecanoyl-(acyl carrier protein) dehydratase